MPSPVRDRGRHGTRHDARRSRRRLHEDLLRLASRRDALRIFGAGGAAAILSSLGPSRALAATPTAEVPTETAVSDGPIVKTSQIALPKSICETVYATSGYAGSRRNLAPTSLSTDIVFRDDHAIHQVAP